MAARLKEHYTTKVIPNLTKDFGYKNIMAVPKIDKISINIGLGEATQNAKLMDGAVTEMTQIVGQKPVVTKATKSIAPKSVPKLPKSASFCSKTTCASARLSRTTILTGRRCCTAVVNSAINMAKPPSPTRATTWRFGEASCAAIA